MSKKLRTAYSQTILPNIRNGFLIQKLLLEPEQGENLFLIHQICFSCSRPITITC